MVYVCTLSTNAKFSEVNPLKSLRKNSFRLSTESLFEPLDAVRFRIGVMRFIRSISSRLNIRPKISFIRSTMCVGSQVGKVQDVTVLWEPLTINGCAVLVAAVVNMIRSCRHAGQQHFDTPIIGPYP